MSDQNKIKQDVNSQNNLTAISYKGEVVVKYVDKKTGKIKKIKQHNQGYLPLFTFITRALAGDYTLYRPIKLMAYNSDKEMLGNSITFTGVPKVKYVNPKDEDSEDENSEDENPKDKDLEDKDWTNTITYIFLIPDSLLNDTKIDINRLALLNTYNQKCADIDLSTPIKTNTGANIIIYWSLTFENAEVTNDEVINE